MALHCLLIHGLGACSFDMQGIGQALAAAGLPVRLVTLPGHDSTEQAFIQARYDQWREHVLHEYDLLAAQGAVLLVGFSLGGLLALDVAQARQPAGIVCIAAPVMLYSWHPFFMPDWRLPLAPLLQKVLPVVRRKGRTDAARRIAPWQGHETLHVTAHLVGMMQAQKRIRAGLGNITAPALIWQAKGDMTCRAYNAFYLAQHLGSSTVTLKLITLHQEGAGHHLLPTHSESAALVAASVRDFALSLA